MKRIENPNGVEGPAGPRAVRGRTLVGPASWLVLLLMLLVAPGFALAHGPVIEIHPDEMKPDLLNLFVGTTVHFSNTLEMPGGLVLVEKQGRLESPPLEHPGDGWHYTFEEEGVYEVFVRQHPEAKARIVVVPKRSTPGR